MQMPARALLADTIPPELFGDSVIYGNSLFAVANGAGKALGYSFGGYADDIRYVNSFAAVAVLVFTLIPTLLTREPPRTLVDDIEASLRRPFFAQLTFMMKEMYSSILAMPKGIRQVFVVQFFTYLSFSTSFIYITEWVAGPETFGGNANAVHTSLAYKTYINGVTFTNRALLVAMIVAIMFAFLLPSLTRIIGLKIWSGSLAMMGVCLLCTLFPLNLVGVSIVILSIALPLSVAFTIPWAIISCSLSGPFAHQRGFFMSIFNLSQATPGLFASLIGSLLIHLSGGRSASALTFSGTAALCGAIASLFVELPDELAGSVKRTASTDKCEGRFPSEPAHAESREKRDASDNV